MARVVLLTLDSPPDPILGEIVRLFHDEAAHSVTGVTEKFKADTSDKKINLGVGECALRTL